MTYPHILTYPYISNVVKFQMYLLDGLADDEIEAHAEDGDGEVTLCLFYVLVMNGLF